MMRHVTFAATDALTPIEDCTGQVGGAPTADRLRSRRDRHRYTLGYLLRRTDITSRGTAPSRGSHTARTSFSDGDESSPTDLGAIRS